MGVAAASGEPDEGRVDSAVGSFAVVIRGLAGPCRAANAEKDSARLSLRLPDQGVYSADRG